VGVGSREALVEVGADVVDACDADEAADECGCTELERTDEAETDLDDLAWACAAANNATRMNDFMVAGERGEMKDEDEVKDELQAKGKWRSERTKRACLLC
jgi:hypothetical protein